MLLETRAPEPRTTTSRSVTGALVGALVVALAIAATFAVLFFREAGVPSDEAVAEDVRRFVSSELPDVETRARRVIELLMNYDATNLDERAQEIRGLATGAFREQYEELIGQGLGEALEKASASSRGQIVEGPDVSFKTASEAVAIARVSQTAQSQSNPAGATYLYVLKLNLVKTSAGEWLADQVEILSEQVA